MAGSRARNSDAGNAVLSRRAIHHTATAADLRARGRRPDGRSRTEPVDSRFKLLYWQEDNLAIYSKEFSQHIASIAKMHWTAKGLVWIGLVEVIVSYAILAAAANNALFKAGSASAVPALSFIGAVVLANSVGLNTYINKMTFIRRMSQIITNMSAWWHNEASLSNNLGRLKFDLARMAVGLVLSLTYSFPFWKAVSDDSPQANTGNPQVEQLSYGFFAAVSYLAIPTRALLVFNSVVAITNKLPVNGQLGYVHRIQSLILARLDNFSKWVEAELKKDKEKRNSSELWAALDKVQKQVNLIQDLSQQISEAKRSRRWAGYGALEESSDNLYQRLETAWQQLGAIISWYPMKDQARPEVLPTSVIKRVEVPHLISFNEQLQTSSQKLCAWAKNNKGLLLYAVTTYLISMLIAAGYVYAQKSKTEEGASDVYHTQAGQPLQEGLVWGALIAAGLFSAHWTYLGFDKMRELWEKNLKMKIFWTALSVACTAAPAAAIALNNQASILLIIASAMAGALMNYVGQRGVLDLLPTDKTVKVVKSDEAVKRAHGTAAETVGELLEATANSIRELIAGDYSTSAKGIIAVGAAWNIHVAGVSTEKALAEAKSSCCGCHNAKCRCVSRSTVTTPGVAPRSTAAPGPNDDAFDDPFASQGAVMVSLLSLQSPGGERLTAEADVKATNTDVSTVDGHVAVVVPNTDSGSVLARHLPFMTRQTVHLTGILKNMCVRPSMHSPDAGPVIQSSPMPPLLLPASTPTPSPERPKRRHSASAPLGRRGSSESSGSPVRQISFRDLISGAAGAGGVVSPLRAVTNAMPATVFSSPASRNLEAAISFIQGANLNSLGAIQAAVTMRRGVLTPTTDTSALTPAF